MPRDILGESLVNSGNPGKIPGNSRAGTASYIIKLALFFRFNHQGASLLENEPLKWLFRPFKVTKRPK